MKPISGYVDVGECFGKPTALRSATRRKSPGVGGGAGGDSGTVILPVTLSPFHVQKQNREGITTISDVSPLCD